MDRKNCFSHANKPQAATLAVGWQVNGCHYLQYLGAQLIPNNNDPSKVRSVLERLLNNLKSKSCQLNYCQGNEVGWQ